MANRFKGGKVNVKKFTIESLETQNIKSKNINSPITIQNTQFHSKGNILANALDLEYLHVDHILTANQLQTTSIHSNTIHSRVIYADKIICKTQFQEFKQSYNTKSKSKFLGGYNISEENVCKIYYNGIANANVQVTLVGKIDMIKNANKGTLKIFETNNFHNNSHNSHICTKYIFDQNQYLLSLNTKPTLTSSIWELVAENCTIEAWEIIFS